MKIPAIRVRGAHQHNLKHLDVDIPLNRFTAITGVSGSGKSSLAFDTLYAEGQRRYVETFSPYARQFMDRMDRPKADKIEGIPPAIAIDRKDPVRTSRSTVGTMTEITDYVKLLFARIGVLRCRECDRPVIPENPRHIWRLLKSMPADTPIFITFPFSMEETSPIDAVKTLLKMGYDRHVVDGRIEDIQHAGSQGRDVLHVLADRFKFRTQDRKRIMDSAEQAFRMGRGHMDLWPDDQRPYSFSNRLSCPYCQIDYQPPLPNLFSFNSPVGACEVCRGFGRIIDIDLDLIIDPGLSIKKGAVKPWGSPPFIRDEYNDLMDFCLSTDIPVDIPFSQLSAEQQNAVIEGSPDFYGIRGFFNYLERKTYKMHVRVFLSRYRSYDLCRACGGTRFKPETLLYSIQEKTIADIYAMSVEQAAEFFNSISDGDIDDATRIVMSEIVGRLKYLKDVGLGYLTIDRQSRTLSGGEVQRVALASALGASLVNTLYILDEPSIGLHPRDTRRLIRILKGIRDIGNTVVVVEHDPDIIRSSDYLIDMGPGAGENGGQIMYFGPTSEVNGSLTGQYLKGTRRISVPERSDASAGFEKKIVIQEAAANNLKNINVEIPLQRFICLTGVSGTGKSTLAEDILYRAARRRAGDLQERPGKHRMISGLEHIDDMVMVDQRAIGRTPRANLLTYTKALNPIRLLLSKTEDAQAREMDAGFFSFNVPRGRCEACNGDGYEHIEMQFLSDVYVTCPVCEGKRFKKKVLEVKYNGKNIYDILCMTVREGIAFFQGHADIVNALQPLADVGLEYARLGQPLSTLSGGEAQRLKLASYLREDIRGHRFFIFDEPTTGLHFEDIRKLLGALRRLVDKGHSLLVIEHNMEMIRACDWIIDLGPEGGDEGGNIVVTGTPETVAGCSVSHTGRYLKDYAFNDSDKLSAADKHHIAETPSPFLFQKTIRVDGARENNLKNISLSIPRDELVVLTGVSGSGKSTLAFDIVFAEGQRRYLESLAPYVRQYLKIMERPDVDRVTGLPPSVGIEQRMSHGGRRSTVATLTEIYHFFRLLFSKLGTRHCPGCGRTMSTQTEKDIIRTIQEHSEDMPAVFLAPKVYNRKGFHKNILARAHKNGYTKARIDGDLVELKPNMRLSRYHDHTIEIVIGNIRSDQSKDLETLVSETLQEGNGILIFLGSQGRERIFSIHSNCPTCGLGLESSDPRLFSFNSPQGACSHCGGTGVMDVPDEELPQVCPRCAGSRLRKEALMVTVGGWSIWDFMKQPVAETIKMVRSLKFTGRETVIAEPIMREIDIRLSLLVRLGLDYLSPGRSGNTLSGGESRRVRLSAQLGSNLTGVLYILDEPTIGLHPRDNTLLIDALRTLRDKGNSILVVEHDEETIRAADTIIDLGPGAGRYGGSVVAQGTLDDLEKAEASVTAACLKHAPGKRRPVKSLNPDSPVIRISGAHANNLKNVDVDFPLNTLICVTGVSGSGKSSLLKGSLYEGLKRTRYRKAQSSGTGMKIRGDESIKRILEVDHSPIGRTPRSIPASYVGFLNDIRSLFSKTAEARSRGYKPGRFSFNVSGGRCETCKGQGTPKVKMSFLPDVYVPCDQCDGRRFNRETLEITYRGADISQVLDMTFWEAADFFTAVPVIRRQIQFVCDIGLGYLRLGQPSPSLSGGEAQRIKLARQLAKPTNGHTFFILDEPSTGLHLFDIHRLIDVIHALVDAGNTVAVIEHNMEMIAAADHIIDMGPEGGEKGGHIVAAGSPEQLLEFTDISHTARYLRDYLSHDLP